MSKSLATAGKRRKTATVVKNRSGAMFPWQLPCFPPLAGEGRRQSPVRPSEMRNIRHGAAHHVVEPVIDHASGHYEDDAQPQIGDPAMPIEELGDEGRGKTHQP